MIINDSKTFNDAVEIYNKIDYRSKGTTKKIYHYTSPEALKSIVMNSCLYATNNAYLNDKTEGWHVFDVLLTNVNDFFGTNTKIETSIKSEIDNMIKKTDDPGWFDSFVISFSLNRDSLGMWNYYTKGNDLLGYNIEFDISKLKKSIVLVNPDDNSQEYKGLKAKDGKVIYKLAEQKKLIYETVKQFDSVNAKYKPYLIVRKLWELGRFLKKPCFEHENEYRFLFSFIHDSKGNLSPAKDEYRTKKGLLIPYQKAAFKKDSITGITCSPSLEARRAKMGVECLFRSYQYEDILDNIVMSDIPVRY